MSIGDGQDQAERTRELSLANKELEAFSYSVSHDLREQNADRNIECEIDKAMTVYGDAGLLRVCLNNLIGNACKYTGKMEHALIKIGSSRIDGNDAYFVRDNGAGFDMQYAGKPFGAFQRMHHDDDFEGTGVGLATVFRIIARHRGEIWAEAEVDKGAAFFFTLPQRAPAAPADPA